MQNDLALKKDWLDNIQSFFSTSTKFSRLLLIGLGALNVFAFAPFDIWPLPFVTLTLLLISILFASKAKTAAQHGFFFGVGWFGVGISWVHVAIADFGGLPTIVSILLMLGLSGYLALYPALAAWLTNKYSSKFGLSIFTLTWLGSELLRGIIFTGFPWLSFGYSQLSSPLRSFAPIFGEVGLQAILLMLVSLFAHCFLALRKHNLRNIVFGHLSIIVGVFIAGLLLAQIQWTTPSTKQVNLALVQGNIEQSIKWQPETELPTMMKYLQMTEPYLADADLVIWPEAAIPRLEVIANDFLRELDSQASQANSAIITGIVDYQPDTKLAFNNLIVLGKKQQTDEFGHYKYLNNNRYQKHHLLPIGEFVPFESILRHIAPLFNLPMSSFSRGAYQQDNLTANGINLTPAICFEIAFPNQVSANLYDQSDIILTVSNDAWFGDSHGPWQHLQIAQMRGLEFGKPVIRVTNNGITAVISEHGTIEGQLPQFKDGVLSHKVALTKGTTPYRKWGNWTLFFFVSALLITVAIYRKQRDKY